MLLILLAACSPTSATVEVSRDEFEALQAQVAALQAQLGDGGSSGQGEDLSATVNDLSDRVEALEEAQGDQADLSQVERELEDLGDALAAVETRMPGFWVAQVENPATGAGEEWEAIEGASLELGLAGSGSVYASCVAYFGDTSIDSGDDLRLAWTDAEGDHSAGNVNDVSGFASGDVRRYDVSAFIALNELSSVRCESIGITWSRVDLVVFRTADQAP